MYNATKFSEWLKTSMAQAGNIGQSELARKAKVSKQVINGILAHSTGRNGKHSRPKEETVDRLARALGRPIAEARVAAGYAPPALDAETEAKIQDAFAVTLLHKHDRLTQTAKETIRPLLEMISREIDRLEKDKK